MRIEASGFAPDTTGTVRQCAPEAGRLGACGNSLPIRFDDAGHAVVQYQLWEDGTGGDRDCADVLASCVVVVDDGDGGLARVRTVFAGGAGSGAEVSVSPARGVRRR